VLQEQLQQLLLCGQGAGFCDKDLVFAISQGVFFEAQLIVQPIRVLKKKVACLHDAGMNGWKG
jgi:hypothetical protein